MLALGESRPVFLCCLSNVGTALLISEVRLDVQLMERPGKEPYYSKTSPFGNKLKGRKILVRVPHLLQKTYRHC